MEEVGRAAHLLLLVGLRLHEVPHVVHILKTQSNIIVRGQCGTVDNFIDVFSLLEPKVSCVSSVGSCSRCLCSLVRVSPCFLSLRFIEHFVSSSFSETITGSKD